MKKTIIITGATGFLGRSLSRLLAQQGCEVITVGRKPGACRNSNRPEAEICAYLDHDIRASFTSILDRYKPDVVLHCAGVINGTSEALKEGNEDLTKEIVLALEKFPVDIQLIFFSSVSALQPLNAYGASKRAAEEIIRLSRVKRWTILQPSLLYGPGDTKNVAKLVERVRFLPLIAIPGGSIVKLQPLYVEDIVPPLQMLVNSNIGNGETFVLAGPGQESLWDMVGTIRDCLQTFCLRLPIPLWPLEWGVMTLHRLLPKLSLPVQQVQTMRDRPKYDIGLATEKLGFSPRAFATGIADTFGRRPGLEQ